MAEFKDGKVLGGRIVRSGISGSGVQASRAIGLPEEPTARSRHTNIE